MEKVIREWTAAQVKNKDIVETKKAEKREGR